MKIQNVYQILQELGLVRSQMEFSRLWLCKSPRYYSSLLARRQEPSIGTLTGLIFRLRNILVHTNKGGDWSAIFTLIQHLELHVGNRVVMDTALRQMPDRSR
ncbi:DUF6626 family protein [Devosia naphthalenivorans]|uniref:DUF6626 family protein n=1 Tax=Devosia naphthalenivorans TaxID=2082392 RepID=UPI000D3D3AB4